MSTGKHTPGKWRVVGKLACVNALEGVPTEMLEGSLLKAYPDLIAERDRLRASNAELVEAASLLLHGYMAHAYLGSRRYDSSADNDPIIIKARAALAKASK